ncbi:hypothetical protein SAMN04488518_11773 [Pseudovibrio ascidiaceicola]|uniref:Uncharacterized protein n=1 Tax=Pseudovibrio ascidiaceicola TaxID=285279 RepID=A0A1I4F3T3_9HYPH|nr:ABZJ_00895 family protein [Pseudovibrio ascidiaceicola]SFL12635.1 hypothetical protein SAMN04488518_11773 [Pseudovibrio ascidiaceicola]
MGSSQISLWTYLRMFAVVYFLISVNLMILTIVCFTFFDVVLPLQYIGYVARFSIGMNVGNSISKKHKQHLNKRILPKLAAYCCLITFIIDGVLVYFSLPNLDRVLLTPVRAVGLLLLIQALSFGLIWLGFRQGVRGAEKAEVKVLM